MLGTAEADAFGAQADSVSRVSRGVGVGAYLHLAVLVGPAHDTAEVAADIGILGGDIAGVNGAGGAVQGDVIFLLKLFAAQGQRLGIT